MSFYSPLDEDELIITHPLLTHLSSLTKVSGLKGFLTLQVAQCSQECCTCCLGYSLLKEKRLTSIPIARELSRIAQALWIWYFTNVFLFLATLICSFLIFSCNDDKRKFGEERASLLDKYRTMFGAYFLIHYEITHYQMTTSMIQNGAWEVYKAE